MNPSILNLLPRSKSHHPVLLGLVLLAGLWADAHRLALAGTVSLGHAGVADASQTTGLADRSGWEWLLEPNACFQSEPEETFTLPLPDAPKSVMQRPLLFERNEGQTAEEVTFLSRGRGYTLFLTKHEAVMMLQTAATSEGAERLGLRQPSAAFAPHAADPKAPEDWRTPKPDGDTAAREATDSSRILRMRLSGSNPNPAVFGDQPQGAKVNYFIGNDASRWRTNIPTYGRVQFEDVYEGIDLVYYGNEGRLEYDFVVAPGADPNQIALEFDGAERLQIDEHGDLVLDVGGREVRWQKPLIYQEVNGRRIEIAGRYRLRHASGRSIALAEAADVRTPASAVPAVQFVTFELAAHDTRLPLVIDPILLYATYLGGTNWDAAHGVAVDRAGSAFVFGETRSPDFPVKNALLATFQGGSADVFVSKYDRIGQLVFSTFIGGSDWESPWDTGQIAVNEAGDCWIAGVTASADFPMAEAVQAMHGGSWWDGFVVKLSSDGNQLLASTYLGGSGYDEIYGLALGPSGDAYVVGRTGSPDFPTANGFQMEWSPISRTDTTPTGDGFVTRYAADGRSLVWSTYKPRTATLGELPSDLAVDSDGNVYSVSRLSGDNSSGWLVSKIRADGGALLFDKRLGPFTGMLGMGHYPVLCLLPQYQQVVIGGETFRPNLPAVNTANPTTSTSTSGNSQTDAYLAKYDATTGNFIAGAYLGGNGPDQPVRLFPSPAGNIIAVGGTSARELGVASGFPVTDSFDPSLLVGASSDIFITELSASDFSIVFSTVVGGPGTDSPRWATQDAVGAVFVTGRTDGRMPTLRAAQPEHAGGGDAFLMKLSLRNARVQITRSGQEVTLSWPAEATDYILEATTSLPAVGWEVVTNTPTINGTERSVQLPLTGNARFFRLRKP